jgi:hypothetical protein
MVRRGFVADRCEGNAMVMNTEAGTPEYSDLPGVLIFSDDIAGSAAVRTAVHDAGGRVSGVVAIADAIDRLDMQVRLAVAVVEVRSDAGGPFDALLAAVDRGASEGKFAAVVTVPIELLDAAAAAIQSRHVTLLCDPTPMERSGAISAALARTPASLADVGSGLKELADEVARIAKTLATLASEDSGRNGSAPAVARPAGSQVSDAALIRAMIRARRLRAQFFPSELFADPAWDMLLDLTAARLERRTVAVSSLCIASAVPPTTALRWIKTLTDGKLFERVADSSDGRRVFIELTQVAESGMLAYLAQFQRILTLR